ncbi:MAG: hypothetical protein M3546_16865 [Actinomycetota bacterium]|nr:hypothetical protein [Actinomycetota bacterium]
MKGSVFLGSVGVGVICVGLVVVTALAFSGDGDSRSEGQDRARIIKGDIDYVSSFDELVARSTLIVYGVPIGRVTFTIQTETGLFGDYVQSVRVLEVIEGEAPSEIQVVRAGVDEEKAREGVERVQSDLLGGPLPHGRTVLFLNASARPDAYSVVGHTQGTVIFGENDQSEAVENRGFEELRGLGLADVKARVKEAKGG